MTAHTSRSDQLCSILFIQRSLVRLTAPSQGNTSLVRVTSESNPFASTRMSRHTDIQIYRKTGQAFNIDRHGEKVGRVADDEYEGLLGDIYHEDIIYLEEQDYH